MHSKRPLQMLQIFVFSITIILVISACSSSADNVPESNEATASVGDRVWLDADRDGIQDEEEVGLEDVEVELRSTDGATTKSTRTDDEGAYSFSQVPAGEYILVFVPPDSYEFSPQDEEEDDALDSDPDPGTGETDAFLLTAGAGSSKWDAGMYEKVTSDPPPPPPPPDDTPTPLILIPGGEYFVTGKFTNGTGDCTANPADFTVPNLILRISEGEMQIEQPGMHLNIGPLLPNGEFDISTGTGPNTERYVGIINPDISATGTYSYTTNDGTCTWDVELEQVAQ